MNTNSEIINNEENINITGDHNEEKEQCERCGEYHCEEDEEHEERELWESNTDGKNICRRCVREEDEAEDGCERCGNAQCSGKDCWEACSVCGEDVAEHEYGGEAEKCFITHHECCACKDYYDELNDDGECPSCGHWDGRMDNGKNGKYK